MTETKRGRKPKTKIVDDIIEKDVEPTIKNDRDDLIQQLMAQIAEQNAKMAEMQEQINNNKSTTIIQQSNSFNSKKIKVVNLMCNPLNISTEPNGEGRVYAFKEYGDTKLIKYDDLVEIVSSYPNTMEKGYAYICDKDAVEALGLAEEYKSLFDKDTMDKVIWLRSETDLELFLGMDDYLQESVAIKIAEKLNANERIDYNYLRTIKDKTGIDIEAIAQDLKDRNRKPTDEE